MSKVLVSCLPNSQRDREHITMNWTLISIRSFHFPLLQSFLYYLLFSFQFQFFTSIHFAWDCTLIARVLKCVLISLQFSMHFHYASIAMMVIICLFDWRCHLFIWCDSCYFFLTHIIHSNIYINIIIWEHILWGMFKVKWTDELLVFDCVSRLCTLAAQLWMYPAIRMQLGSE